MNENTDFHLDDFNIERRSELATDTRRNKAMKKRQLYNNTSNYNYKVSKSQHQSIISVGQHSLDQVEYNVEYNNATELLQLNPDDVMYPKKKTNAKKNNTV